MKAHPRPAILELGPDFYDEVEAARFPDLQLRYRNQSAATQIGLDGFSAAEWQKHFAEFAALPGNLPKPLALRYHGHQFTSYNPDLGDGRGFLFAQIQAQGRLWDLGTKGSGQTPYSRQGDGRLTLKGAFREILATELLESYGVDTSRTLSVFETGENLVRNDEPSPTRAGVLVRLNHSHIRFGTFQRLAFLGEKEALHQLVRYCLKYYFPDLGLGADAAVEDFFAEVCRRSARTAAQWMMCGFVHGVMNTDNMNVTGESFDYGPYRFLPRYELGFTAAYFDHQGLYAYGRQPIMMLWNLEQLSKALAVAWPENGFSDCLEDFSEVFHEEAAKIFLRRLNLKPKAGAKDAASNKGGAKTESETKTGGDVKTNGDTKTGNLLSAFFQFLQETKAGFEQTFFDLHSIESEGAGGSEVMGRSAGASTGESAGENAGRSESQIAVKTGAASGSRINSSPQSDLYRHPLFSTLLDVLKDFAVDDRQKVSHPYFLESTPCTLLIDELESIWNPIATHDDWSLFENKLQQIRSFRGIY